MNNITFKLFYFILQVISWVLFARWYSKLIWLRHGTFQSTGRETPVPCISVAATALILPWCVYLQIHYQLLLHIISFILCVEILSFVDDSTLNLIYIFYLYVDVFLATVKINFCDLITQGTE